MQCDVRSMTERHADDEQNNQDENDANEGRVGQVCREWLVREDEVVANRLQDEEFEHHYGHNRSKNHLVRTDTKQARTLQTEEEITAAEVQRQVEVMYLKQEEEDAKIAGEIQDLMSQQEMERKFHQQEADEQYARHLQEKEKERIQKKKLEKGLIKEQRQVEKVLAQHIKVQTHPSSSSSNDELNATGVLESDFSDLCVQPSPNMGEDETKVLQEQQDEELARLLQDQESKRGTVSDLDKKLAVETQDREIAKYLQEQERAKVKKARERAKLRAQQRKQELSQETGESLPDEACSSATIDTSSLQRDITTSSRHQRSTPSSSSRDSSQLSNIAMAIDPTYNRKNPEAGRISPTSSLSAPVTPIKKSSSSKTSSTSPSYHTEIRTLSPESEYRSSYAQEHEDDDDDDDPVPPYMPIQGQRRVNSLEKASKKNRKDGCKNQ